jgi:hypothetical protein
MAEFSLVETNVDCCASCTGIGEECKKGFAWIYCDIRANNDDEFNDDCGELFGCDMFIRKISIS